MIRNTFDLSGMGGGYEEMCQKMLWRGVKHLETIKPSVEMWQGATEYKNIYGIMITDGVELKALESSMLPPDDNDCSGAMHQCVMGHLRFIHRNGLIKWEEGLRPHRLKDDEHFQFDDEAMRIVGFPPETDLSREMEYHNG